MASITQDRKYRLSLIKYAHPNQHTPDEIKRISLMINGLSRSTYSGGCEILEIH